MESERGHNLSPLQDHGRGRGRKREVDKKQIREAQALAGSLLWLSTRSRPDLAFGVAAISRLVTRNPRKAIEIAHVLLTYVKGNPGDLHYTGALHNMWGVRGQLKIPRHSKLIEVFADIAYGTGSGHRSVQGLAVYFAGAPIAWQSSSQPFVTHSTAEAELVSYCEALTVGRATEALLRAMWGEELSNANSFEQVIYGDNAAAISLAYGNSSTSWRTRHLRVRSNILKEALDTKSSYPGGRWQLSHLCGTELVADGLTKPLLGQSFVEFIKDLGLKEADIKMKKVKENVHGLPSQGQQTALKAMVAGGTLVRAAEAQGEPEGDPTLGNLWLCGLILVVIGAIWVGKAAMQTLGCCLRRLQLTTGQFQSMGDDAGDPQPTSLRRGRARPRGRWTLWSEEENTTTSEETATEETEAEEEAEMARESKVRRRKAMARAGDHDQEVDRQGDSRGTTTSRKSSLSRQARPHSGSTSGFRRHDERLQQPLQVRPMVG